MTYEPFEFSLLRVFSLCLLFPNSYKHIIFHVDFILMA